ncbi:MAG TPA: galactokinase [Gemmatimonadales bacterium]
MTDHALEPRDVLVAFRDLYGVSPTLRVRAPGRVNLIGEHIDYNGLAVFPMAIQREIRIVCRRRRDRTVRAVAAMSEFGPREFTLGEHIEPYASGDWGNYVKAAAQVVAECYGVHAGMDALIESTIPVAAGLSSSSALVVAVAWALLALNEVHADRAELAGLLAEGERYVGTHGGGMDQAIVLGAEVNSAARVDFDPVRLTHVPVPDDWRFVVAHSLTRAEKSGAAQRVYNRRTGECARALEIVCDALGTPGLSYAQLGSGHPTTHLLDVAGSVMEPVLFARFRHVITEAGRVRDAEAAMRAADLAAFGALMDASHASLRDDYDVSTTELDALVVLARGAGARGARLTGAGLGGCVIMLCDDGAEDNLLRTLARNFYGPRSRSHDMADLAFAVKPCPGVTAHSLESDDVHAREESKQSPGG